MPKPMKIESAPAVTSPIPTLIKEQTIITRTGPASAPIEPQNEPGKTPVDIYFHGMSPQDRFNKHIIYIRRLDPNVLIVNENQGDYRGKFLRRVTVDDFAEFADQPFSLGIQNWIQSKFGGGKFYWTCSLKKTSESIYSKNVETEGDAILTEREAWKHGAPPGQIMSGDSTTQRVLEMVIKTIDEKLAAVSANRQDPQKAFTEALESVSRIQSEALKLAIENLPKNSPPTDRLAELKSMVEMFALLENKRTVAAPVADAKSQIKDILEVMALIEARRNPAESNSAEKIAGAVVGALKSTGALGKQVTRGTDWSWLEPVLKTVAPGAIALLTPLVQRFAAGSPAGGPPAGAPIVLQRQTAAMIQAPAGNGNTGFPPLRTVPTPTPEPHAATATPSTAPASPQTVTPEMANAVRWHDLRHAVVDWIRHDMDGAEAAATVKNIYPDHCAQLAAMPIPMLKAMFQNDDVLREVKDHPKLDGFIGSFLAYLNPPPDGPDEPDEPSTDSAHEHAS